MKHFLILLGFLVTFAACKKNDFAEEDEAIILAYIEDNNITASMTEEGVYYQILTQGTGIYPTVNSEVTVHYTGWLSDNTQFESSYDSGVPITFPLGALIEGWQIGLPLIQEGGSILLMIPSRYGYGDTATQTIPANSVLIFEIDLLEVS